MSLDLVRENGATARQIGAQRPSNRLAVFVKRIHLTTLDESYLIGMRANQSESEAPRFVVQATELAKSFGVAKSCCPLRLGSRTVVRRGRTRAVVGMAPGVPSSFTAAMP